LVNVDASSNSKVSGVISVSPVITWIFPGVNENRDFTLYPNPFNSSETLIIESKTKRDFSLTVFDLDGKTIYVSGSVASIQYIDAGIIGKAGMYFVEISVGEKRERIKIVKSN